MANVDRNAWEHRLCEMHRFYLVQCSIHVSQGDAQAFRLRAEIIQQPDQYQLSIWLRSHPQFDRFATFANLDQPEIGYAEFLKAQRRHRIEPVQARCLASPRRQKSCQLRIGLRRPPSHPKLDGDSQIGVTGRHNAARA